MALYKRGDITTADESAMTHANIGYGPLPAGWWSTDIGSVDPSGSAFHGSGTFTLNSSGSDIWSTADEFHFASRSATGDCEITARVSWQENTHANPKAGVMIRNGVGNSAAFAHVVLQPGVTGARFHRRLTTSGTVASIGSTALPDTWIRVRRVGSTFSAWTSADGASWTQLGSSVSITMGSSVKIGLTGCSAVVGTLNTETFDDVAVTL